MNFQRRFLHLLADGVEYSLYHDIQDIFIFLGCGIKESGICKFWMGTQKRQQFSNLSKTCLFTFRGRIRWGKIVVEAISGFVLASLVVRNL